MNKNIKTYLNSFKPKKNHLISIAIDIIFLLIIIGVLFFSSKAIESNALELMQGQDTSADLEKFLVTASEEQLESYANLIQHFVIYSILGIVAFLAFTLIFYSFSRCLLWNTLLNKKFNKKRFWKWNSLNIILLVIFLVYLFVVLLIKLILVGLVGLINNPNIVSIFDSLLTLLFTLIWLTMVFLTYKYFTEEYQVFKAIRKSFQALKGKWSQFGMIYLFSLLTGIVLAVILYPLTLKFQYQQNILTIVSVIVGFIFLAWFRIYLLKAMESKT